MNKKDLDKFRAQLIGLSESLGEQLRQLEADLHKSRRDASGDLSGYSYHMADVGTDASAQEVEGNIVSAESETLHKIDDALDRIDEGRFGVCEMCGEQIGLKRLGAVPYAGMCIGCQSETERAKA